MDYKGVDRTYRTRTTTNDFLEIKTIAAELVLPVHRIIPFYQRGKGNGMIQPYKLWHCGCHPNVSFDSYYIGIFTPLAFGVVPQAHAGLQYRLSELLQLLV
jgi:hypothetical protein